MTPGHPVGRPLCSALARSGSKRQLRSGSVPGLWQLGTTLQVPKNRPCSQTLERQRTTHLLWEQR